MSEFQNLDKLTNSLYNDGVKKAQEEADILLEKADSEAKKIRALAEQQAKEILNSAKKEAEDLIESTNTELRLKSKRVISDTQNSVIEAFNEIVVDKNIDKTLDSPKFYSSIIEALIQNSEFTKGRVLLPERFRDKLSEFLDNQIQQNLENLECHFSKELELGFRVQVNEKGYYLSFEEDDFIRYFREQLTQRSKSILLGD